MAEPVTLERHPSAGRSRAVPIRLVHHWARAPQGGSARAVQALRGARQIRSQEGHDLGPG